MSPSEGSRVLVVDDDPEVLNFFGHLLGRMGHKTVRVATGMEASTALSEAPFDLALVDLKLPDTDGLQVLREAKKLHPSCEVVIMTGYSTVKSAIQAIQLGAYDYLEKPFGALEDLEAVISRALDQRQPPGGEVIEEFGFVVGRSPVMRRLVQVADRIARKNITVLIQGETGTGKEVLARFIHGVSHRAGGPFVAVNCGAFSETLLESELFGHEKGSFTGASSQRRGVFELAHDGTLFLDEVAASTPAIQVKLLRVLETGEFYRVGGERPLKADVRLIAACNEDLKEEVSHGRFREDLFYRLDVASLVVPPLRERREDILVLAQYFLSKLDPARRLSTAAEALLEAYPWPGNVRQLANVLAQAVALSDGDTIDDVHIAEKLSLRRRGSSDARDPLDGLADRVIREAVSLVDLSSPVDLASIMAKLRRIEVEAAAGIASKALKETVGNRKEAARLLGVTPRVLRYVLRERKT